MMATPTTNTMKRLLPICLLTSLLLPAMGWCQTSPQGSEADLSKPLNLSIPKDKWGWYGTTGPVAAAASTRDTSRPGAVGDRPPGFQLPYGSGYENRQRSLGQGLPGGSRGGMGRRR